MKNDVLVAKICKLPEEFERVENKSFYQLLKETGVSGNKAIISIENIKNYLKNNVDLVETWLLYSMNKRTDEGWYFKEGNKRTYVVGYLLKNGSSKDESKYADKIQACASFIHNELISMSK